MSELQISCFQQTPYHIQKIASLPAINNIPGEIQQMAIQYKTLKASESPHQRVAVRFMYHCLIADILFPSSGNRHGKASFRVIECLRFSCRLVDISVSQETGFVLVWNEIGDLSLWNGSALRVLYKRGVPLEKLQHRPSVIVKMDQNFLLSKSLPQPVTCRCTFTSHPQLAITAENNSIFSFDFRVIMTPHYVLCASIYQRWETESDSSPEATPSIENEERRFRDFGTRVQFLSAFLFWNQHGLHGITL